MAHEFARRREAVYERLGETGALVLAAAPELIIGRDTELRYQVDAELYYLSGYSEPEAVLVLAPSNSKARFTMFVRPRDETRELWTGVRGGEAAARELFGADAAFPIGELGQRLPELLQGSEVIFARLRAGRSDVDRAVESALARARAGRARTGRGPHTVTDAGLLLDLMRALKDAGEIELMRQAARMQRKIEQAKNELKDKEVTAESVAGKVKVTVTYGRKVSRIEIDPEFLKSEGTELALDGVVAATNSGLEQAEKAMEAEIEKITGGTKIPGLT